jgi:hypothetical protein
MNRWIDLWSESELLPGIHFQCLPFGGGAGAHLSFEDPDDLEEIIAAVKINRHSMLLIDRDRASASAPLKLHTERLKCEAEAHGYAWVTLGKEVENYIPAECIRSYLGLDPSESVPGRYRDVLAFLKQRKGVKTLRKVTLARAIAPLLTRELIEAQGDMPTHLDTMCGFIRRWNGLPEAAPKA